MTRWVPSTQTSAWVALLAGVLPLWLLGLAVSLEGFPAPPVPPVVGLTAFLLALILGGVALWRGWLRPEIAVIGLFPLLLVPLFDEITTTYKTPFIFACAALLSAAIGGLQAARLLAGGTAASCLAGRAAPRCSRVDPGPGRARRRQLLGSDRPARLSRVLPRCVWVRAAPGRCAALVGSVFVLRDRSPSAAAANWAGDISPAQAVRAAGRPYGI